MKKNMLIFIMMFCIAIMNAQVITYKDLEQAKKKPKNNNTAYIAKDGIKYAIGDTIDVLLPSANGSFAFIKGAGMLVPVGSNASSIISGRRARIKKIWFAGTKKGGYQVVLKCYGLGDYLIYLEGAVAMGEIKKR